MIIYKCHRGDKFQIAHNINTSYKNILRPIFKILITSNMLLNIVICRSLSVKVVFARFEKILIHMILKIKKVFDGSLLKININLFSDYSKRNNISHI